MIKITDGVSIHEVTRGAFETTFKALGFHVYDDAIDGEKAKVADVVIATEPEVQVETSAPAKSEAEVEAEEDANWCEELREKPISQWNKGEIKRYAQICGIDLSGTRTVGEARERIKKSWS